MRMTIKHLAMVVCVAGALAAPKADATIFVVPDSPSTDYKEESKELKATFIAELLHITTSQLGTVVYEYQPNKTPHETGTPLSDSYEATVVGTGQDYVIDLAYTGGKIADATYLVCKDGNLGTRIFDISAWNGTDTLEFGNPWPALEDGKTITGLSHFQIYGTAVDHVSSVPEPSTICAGVLTLLPFGVGALRSLRRKE